MLKAWTGRRRNLRSTQPLKIDEFFPAQTSPQESNAAGPSSSTAFTQVPTFASPSPTPSVPTLDQSTGMPTTDWTTFESTWMSSSSQISQAYSSPWWAPLYTTDAGIPQHANVSAGQDHELQPFVWPHLSLKVCGDLPTALINLPLTFNHSKSFAHFVQVVVADPFILADYL